LLKELNLPLVCTLAVIPLRSRDCERLRQHVFAGLCASAKLSSTFTPAA
jgi:hypothetical protein